MIRNLVAILSLLLTSSSFAQEEFLVHTISSEMKQQANAVVRSENVTVTIRSIDKLIVETDIIITVLNKEGVRFAEPSEFYDTSIKIKDQDAKIYDARGKELKKFGRSDFKDVSAISSGDLYTDNRLKYLSYTPTQYPYTLHYKSTVEHNQTAFIRPWVPINGHYLSVEESIYTLINEADIPSKYKVANIDGYSVTRNEDGSNLSFTLEKAHAIPREDMAPKITNLTPVVKFGLEKFSLVKVEGDATNWKVFGKWQNDNLLAGLDEISKATILEVTNLVDGISSERERVKAIYEYVQNKTRYISVQLGIGGWKPYPAKEVDALGYGDCKGLTNYTKAVLQSQGIKSYYSVVFAGQEKRDIDPEFTSMQGNHVILNVPLDDEEIWLECTNQVAPFNFLGDFTDDREVLVITEEGGVLKRTAQYDYEASSQRSDGQITIAEDGKVSGLVRISSKGIQYDNKIGLEDGDREEKVAHYMNVWSELKRLEVMNISMENDRDIIEFRESVSIAAENYVDIVNEKYIFRPNTFNINSYIPKKYTKRRSPFRIQRGYTDIDENVISVPPTFVPDYIPESMVIESSFGNYSASVQTNADGTYSYKRKLVLKEGSYPASDYGDYREFRRKIRKFDNVKLVFKK